MLENNKNAVTVIYSGGDIQVPFIFYDQNDLVVLYEIIPKTLGTDYTVAGAGREVGGKITLVSQPENGTRVTVIRKVDFTQLLQIPANGIIPEGALNRALDRIVMMIQQLEERADRSVTYPEGTDTKAVLNVAEVLKKVDKARTDANKTAQDIKVSVTAANTAVNVCRTTVEVVENKRQQVLQNGAEQIQRVLDEGNTQHTRIVNEGNAQYALVQNMGNTKASNITTKHQAAVNEIDAKKVEAKAQVDARKQQAINEVAALPNYAKNYDAILNDKVNDLVTGTIAGSEGRWKLTQVHTVKVTNVATENAWGTPATAIICTGVVGSYGLSNSIDVKTQALVVGESGGIYESTHGLAGIIYLHPKYGNAGSDFIATKSYPVYVFQESTEIQTGDLDVVEYFLGGNHHSSSGGGARQGLVYSGVYPLVNDAGHHYMHLYDLNQYVSRNSEVALTIKNNSSYAFESVPNHTFCHTVAPQGGHGSFDMFSPPIPAGQTGTVKGTAPAGSILTYIEMNNQQGTNSVSYEIVSITVDGVPITLNNSYITYGFRVKALKSLLDVIAIGDYATFNAGYWEGKSWKNQLLGDVGLVSNDIVLKLGRKSAGADNARIVDKLEVLKVNGDWHEYVPNYPTGQGQFAGNTTMNTVAVNVKQSSIGLGFSDDADMLAKSVVRATYKTKARRMRPDVNPAGMLCMDKLVYLQNFSVSWSRISNELCRSVLTGGGNPHTIRPAIVQHPITAPGKVAWDVPQYYGKYDDSRKLGTTSYKTACMNLFFLFKRGGTLHIGTWFKELVLESDWGDDNSIPTKSYVTTTTDDNGNAILCGCMTYDTGLPV